MLSFDPEGRGLVAPSTADIRAEVAGAFVSAFRKDGVPDLDTNPETPAGQLIDSITAMIADNNAELLFLANQFNPRVASGMWQAALGEIYFLTPSPAKSSVAECTCTGLSGTVIPAGALIQSTADNTQWASISDITIPASGSVTAEFACQTPGEVTASSGTLTQIVTVTPGWDSVTNATAATVGNLRESRLDFETRRYNSVAINARGSINALWGALRQVAGVIDCAVLENDTKTTQTKSGVSIPANSLFISIVGGADADIAQAIYQNKDAGITTVGNTAVTYTDTTITGNPVYIYNIERPASLAFGVKITIKQTSSTSAAIVSNIKNAVLNNFNGGSEYPRVGIAQTVYSSRFYADVIVAGAEELLSIEIAAPVSGGSWQTAIDVDADESPTLDAADITVVIQQ